MDKQWCSSITNRRELNKIQARHKACLPLSQLEITLEDNDDANLNNDLRTINEKSCGLLSIILLELQGNGLLQFFLPQFRRVLSDSLIILAALIGLILERVVGLHCFLLRLRPSVLFLPLQTLAALVWLLVILVSGKWVHDVDIGGNEVVDGESIHSLLVLVLFVLVLRLLGLLVLFLLYLQVLLY